MGTIIAIGAGLAVLAGAGAGIGIGIATSKATEAVARQHNTHQRQCCRDVQILGWRLESQYTKQVRHAQIHQHGCQIRRIAFSFLSEDSLANALQPRNSVLQKELSASGMFNFPTVRHNQ